MLFDLEPIGDPDDGMVSVHTGCINGLGEKQIAVVAIDRARQKTVDGQALPPTGAMDAIAWANSELKLLSSKGSLTQFEEGSLYAVKVVCGLGATAP